MALSGSTAQRAISSMCFTKVLEYLSQSQATQLQVMSRYFYFVQLPRCQAATIKVASSGYRLHLLNQDYIVLFNLLNKSKQMRRIKNADHECLWNQQSIEVRGRIYVTGGAIANSKTYLKQTSVLNERNWCFEKLSDMHFERDAHGCTKWLNRYIIVVGSWHGE